tara:strand:+ start:255 stop:443 length:189 start_codon:yes stop_codon:yes gene_type:complete
MTNYERKLKSINKSYVEELSDRQLTHLESNLFVANTLSKIDKRHLVKEVQDIVREEIKTRRL